MISHFRLLAHALKIHMRHSMKYWLVNRDPYVMKFIFFVYSYFTAHYNIIKLMNDGKMLIHEILVAYYLQ